MNGESGVTRRWVLRIGSAAALSGASGMDLGGASTALPPGLYEPSLDHVAHVIKVQAVEPASAPLQFFTTDEAHLLNKLAGLILDEPADQPTVAEICVWIDRSVFASAGARAAGESLTPPQRQLAMLYYGEEKLNKRGEVNPQVLSRQGLEALARSGFAQLDETRQIEKLVSLENGGDSFLAWLKARVLEGFYTSKQGLKELDYKGNSFYAESPGCSHG